MKEINPINWYMEREMSYCPKHFVGTNTPIDKEKKLWILEKLQGRFYISSHPKKTSLFFNVDYYPFFEDPQEAVYYELTWS